ncbi:MAG: potassium channel protein [Syntrophales bacterium]
MKKFESEKLQANPLIRLIIPGLLILAILIVGTIGYVKLEGWGIFESLYMVVITLSTVGFREIHELNTAGRLLTMSIIVFGIGTVGYTVGQIVEIIVEDQVGGYRRRRKMEKKIANFKNHYIICGFGRVGHQIAREFAGAKINYVVIDNKPETTAELAGSSIPFFVGNMTTDKILLDAGIKNAKGLVAAADSDTDNVFVTLSARVLNPRLFIIARTGTVEAEEKLKKAGADRVISPYFIAGKQMAAMATKPTAIDFFDSIIHNGHLQVAMSEVKVNNNCQVVNKSLKDSQIRQKCGAYIITIKKANGQLEMQPTATSKIEPEDILVAIGTAEQLGGLEELVA